MPPKRSAPSNTRVENIKVLRREAQQNLRALRSDLKKDAARHTRNPCSEASMDALSTLFGDVRLQMHCAWRVASCAGT